MAQSKPDSKISTANVNLEKLSQSQTAFMIGRPPRWLQTNSHLFTRDDDGMYDARQVVKAMQQVGDGAAELADEHLEPLQTWLYDVTHHEGSLTGCLRVVDEIIDRHGTSGLAAIGQLVRDIAQSHLKMIPEPIESEDSIRDRHRIEIERETGWIPGSIAKRDMRVVPICERCKRYRWGRKWLEQPLPEGYISDGFDLCPDCSETAIGPKSR